MTTTDRLAAELAALGNGIAPLLVRFVSAAMIGDRATAAGARGEVHELLDAMLDRLGDAMQREARRAAGLDQAKGGGDDV